MSAPNAIQLQEDSVSTTVAPVEAIDLSQGTGYQLVAIDNAQMQNAHAKMIEWARGMQAQCDAEGAEEGANLSVAVERKWATEPFKKRIRMLERRRQFYKKIEDALLAGYVIVPNFEMNVFAVRTDAKKPTQQNQTSDMSWSNPQFTQDAKQLPSGDGEYVNPVIPKESDSFTAQDNAGKTVTQYTHHTLDEFNDISFPLALAKPVLMSATAEAMAHKVFDEVGVAVDTRWRGSRRGDPILLGRIRNPRSGNKPDITFFIGWYFDPSNL